MRAKTFVAVGHETANRDKRVLSGKGEAVDADLLANMELGVHSHGAGGDLSPAAAAGGASGGPSKAPGGTHADSPRGGDDGDLYYRGASLPDEDGIELSSAPV